MPLDIPLLTRFAPSPSGYLHLGHAYSALFAAHEAESAGGRFLLRIEDIDTGRCKPEYETAILEDLAWLGLEWPEPVLRQSERIAVYDTFLHTLEESGLTYPCFCTRNDIRREIEEAERAPHSSLQGSLYGSDGPVYPGICKHLSQSEAEDRIASGEAYALRIHMDRAARMTGPLTFTDRRFGEVAVSPESCGDVVIARKDIATSYHLSVTVDDALQHIGLVTRGEDILPSTHIHRILQTLLGFPEPVYHHHPLLTDGDGNRYAKRDRSLTLRALREAGETPDAIRKRLGF